MLCCLTRWAISRSEDRGGKAPRWADRHAARCASCRDFARFTASLGSRLRAEKGALLDAAPDFPLDRAGWARGEKGAKVRIPFGRRLVLHPLPAGAAAVAVLAAAFVLFRIVPREPAPTPADRAAARDAFQSLVAAPGGWGEALAGAESSLEKERRILKESFSSAVEYLQARLNIRIERRQPPRSG